VGPLVRFAGVLSTGGEATSCVTNASWVAVGTGVGVVVTPNTKGPRAVGVSGIYAAGAGEDVGGMPPNGVGVAYCPHSDALPTHEVAMKETAIKRLGIRFMFRPFRELYLY